MAGYHTAEVLESCPKITFLSNHEPTHGTGEVLDIQKRELAKLKPQGKNTHTHKRSDAQTVAMTVRVGGRF